MTSIAQQYDCLLLDLDGTVFRGEEPTTGAVDTLAAVAARKLYVTNNASRAPADVAQHLGALGFAAETEDVVTSAQSAARLLSTQLAARAPVLVVGTEALAEEVRKVGLKPVRSWSEEPVAVVQGHSPKTGWPDLAEAALALRAGAVWVAANVDRSLPSERGLLPGNGAMVAALQAATDREPQVAGKPAPALLTDALSRGRFTAPLVVGDRLDTDIAGANRAGLPSLMVLCGVSTVAEMVCAPAGQRPDFLGEDLRALSIPADELRIGPHPGWRVDIDFPTSPAPAPATATVTATGGTLGDSLSAARATAAAIWDAGVDGDAITVRAGDDSAAEALRRWSLLGPLIG